MISTDKIVTPLRAAIVLVLFGASAAWGAYAYLDSMREESRKAREEARTENAALAAQVTEKVDTVADAVSELKHSSEMGSTVVTNKLERIDDALRRMDETCVPEPDLRLWIQAAKAVIPELPDYPIR